MWRTLAEVIDDLQGERQGLAHSNYAHHAVQRLNVYSTMP